VLKGIANTGGGDSPEDPDRYGIVVALSHLSETLASAEVDTALDTAAETATALLRVPSAIVFIRTDGGELRSSGWAGVDGNDPLTEAAHEIALDALSSNAPVVITDTAAASAGGSRKLAEAGVASAICVLMRVNDNSVGAVVALSKVQRAFSPSDIELLHVVASHAALAAWRMSSTDEDAMARESSRDELIRLADRKIKDLSLLNQVSEAMSSTLDMEVLLDIALEQSLAAVGADGGSLMLISEDTGKLEIVAARGLAKKLVETTSQDIGNSIAGWVAAHGESVLVTDAHRDSRFSMPFFRDTITSSASVPLKIQRSVIGVLNVNTVKPDRIFDERDLELLATVCNQMAVAIENARLYARVNRRTQELASLLRISKTVTSTLNLDEVLHRLSDQMCSLFQLDVCVLLLMDEMSGRLRFGHGTGLKTRRKHAHYDLAAPIAARIRNSGKKVVLRDIEASDSLCTDIARSEGLKAVVGLPLKNQGKLVAMAIGFARQARVFTKSQRSILQPLGDLGGVAVENARTYRRKYKIAALLQQRLVPTGMPPMEGLDLGHKFLPAREVGGDFYDFVPLGPRSVGVIMADVAGNDVDAAEYTTMGKHVLRAYARECRSPAAVLSKTNDLICESTSAEMFISTFYGVIDLEFMTLTHANAGCEPGLLYRARDKSVTSLRADGMLLGIACGVSFDERRIELEPGDVLVLFTDGLTEAAASNRRFGSQQVMDTIAASAHLGAQMIADHIHDALIEFVHGRVADDVAMVVLKMR